jgi:ACS family tartrate transporter-like MFS transporter
LRSSFATSIASPIAIIVGAPISNRLLALHGALGLRGWQWLFLLEGLPAVVLGFVVLRALPERPSNAVWLTDEERRALMDRLELEAAPPSTSVDTVAGALTTGRVWLLAAVYFTIPVALYAMGFWLPQIVKSTSGSSDATVGVLSAIPYAVAAVGMVVVGRHSDRTGERRWHVAIAAMVGGVGFACAALVHGPMWSLVMLSVAMLGLASMFGPFWTLTTTPTARAGSARAARGVGLAASIALVNSVGNIGGFVGPNIIGYITQQTSSLTAGLAVIGAILAGGGLLVLAASDRR